MNLTNTKIVPVILPQAIIDNASATSNVVDLKGAKYVQVFVQLGATDIAMTALKLQESDVKASDTALTSGTDITGLDFTGALPSATDDNKTYIFAFPVEGRKRYIDLVATCGDGAAGTFITAWAVLHQNEIHNFDATSTNVAAIKRLPV